MPKTPRIHVLVFTLVLAGCEAPAPDLGPPPNVLLLVIDCLRADHLSVNGYERPTTPHLDALAAEGVQFTRTISQASWTRPSLPTILTGLYPSEHGLHSFDESEGGSVKSPSLAESVTTVAEALKARGYRTALIGEQFQLSPRFGLNQGFDFYKNRADKAANIHRNFFRWLEREDAGGGPFFTYLHYLEIHWPYCPPAEVRGTFDDGRSEIRFCRAWRELRKDILDGEIELSDADRYVMKARYDEELLGLDRHLGELFAELRERGLWDDTLIVVTSDHGEEFYEHGSMGHGQSLYGELIDIPLLMKPPASWPFEPGRRIDALVESRNITPTFLEAAGAVPLPDLAATSLVPWVMGSPEDDPVPFVVSESNDHVVVRTKDLKLIARRDGQDAELYDLAVDPGESTDLVRERRKELLELRGHLETWLENLRPPAEAEVRELDQETLEGLKALGYLDG